jgi:hypothetical protein
MLLLRSKQSHFSQTNSLKKSKKCADFRFFFLAPSGGKMLIETAVKNGARAPEEVYPAVLRGEIKYNLWPEMAHKGVSFFLFFSR